MYIIKSYGLLCCVMIFNYFDMAISLSVNFSSINLGDDGLPTDVSVSLSVGSNSSKEFHLTRIDHISINVPVYSISTDPTGNTLLKNENVPNTQNIAFYQDKEKHAVIQLTAHNGTDDKSTNLVITRGEYVEGDSRYSITPTVREKRDTWENRLDQQYDLKTIKSPHRSSFDFVLPDLKETLPSVEMLKERSPNRSTQYRRRKRQSQRTIYIDVTAVLHSTCYMRFLTQASYDTAVALTKIQEYYAFIFSGVDLVYQGFNTSNFLLRVKLTKVVIFKSSSDFQLSFISGSNTKVDTDASLKNLKNYLATSTGVALVFPYDHAMMFVDSDLWLTTMDIVGLAFVGTLCSVTGSSSSVIEDIGIYDSLTPAHELGHSLSARHDGTSNNCSAASQYLMADARSAPTNDTELNPWKFSPCTMEYFQTFITATLKTSTGNECLTSSLTVTGDFPDVSSRLLGQEIPENKQCQLKFGTSSYDCKFKEYTKCEMIYCWDPAPGNWCYGQTPLPGTSCGCGKVCKQGSCVTDVLSPVCNLWTNCTSDICNNAAINDNCAKTCNFTSWLSISQLVSTSTSQTPASSITSSVTTRISTMVSVGSSTGKSEPASDCKDGSISDENCDTYLMRSSWNMCYNITIRTTCCASCLKRATYIQGCEYGNRDNSTCFSISSCQSLSYVCCQTCGTSRGLRHDQFLMTFTFVSTVLFLLQS